MSIHSKLRVEEPEFRRWPYPYRAAASISNDADFCSFAFFEAFMHYCNTRQTTPFGEGLGIEVTSSFFGFSPPGRQFSYFDGLAPDAPPSGTAPRLAEYLRSGWIDANHAFGDFDGLGGFQRAHAERFYEELHRVGGDVRVFINHGDEYNHQCIGPGTPHHRGDAAGAPEYHTDLINIGPWFVTTSVHSIGHVDESPPPASDLREPRRGFLRGKPLFRDEANRLLRPYLLQDGREVTAFMRLRGTGYNAPNLGSLTYQTSIIDFDELYTDEGVVVLYQHWGVLHRARRRCHPATIREASARPELWVGLKRLAVEANAGKLWVAGLQRLLDYVVMIENTSVMPQTNPGEFNLASAVPVADPGRFFQGLTLYADPAVDARIKFEGRPLLLQFNGPDHTGRYSISVPCTPMDNIW